MLHTKAAASARTDAGGRQGWVTRVGEGLVKTQVRQDEDDSSQEEQSVFVKISRISIRVR